MFSAIVGMHLSTLKLDSYHALFRDGPHFGTDVCVVDWFSNIYAQIKQLLVLL